MVTVMRWTGREASALRKALRMSVRSFANHTGLGTTTIVDMEAKGEQAQLRHATQKILDDALAAAADEARQRFFALVGDTVLQSDSAGVLRDAVASTKLEISSDPEAVDQLAASSAQRTRSLLDTLRATMRSQLRYVVPLSAVDNVAAFLASPSRVHVVKGPPGCGKTRLSYHIAAELLTDIDVQLHAIDAWDLRDLDLAAEILRYASIPTGRDALLTLEHASRKLSRPCLVVLDCVRGQEELNAVGRQMDAVLRQVLSDRLRLLLVVRTPPDVDMSAPPVLAASVFTPADAPPGSSLRMEPWTNLQAAQAWDLSRRPREPWFTDLPPPVQQLARLPLYMELLRTAGHDTASGAVDAYRLVDHCVRSILRTSGEEPETVMATLEDLTAREIPDLVPAALTFRTPRRPPQLRRAWPDIPLLRVYDGGCRTFAHDVLREHFLANRVSDLLIEHGRSSVTIGALNELATQAATTATARSVFDFTVSRTDRQAPDLMAAIALSPTIGADTTLPAMVHAIGSQLGSEVLRVYARRCVREHAVELARSLIATPAVATALGDDHAAWIVELLRTFGFAVWAETASDVERSFDAGEVARLLAAANLDDADEATFFAGHFFAFVSDTADSTGLLDALLSHADWRVRAALAEGTLDERAYRSATTGLILDQLVTDVDYKVRAAAGKAIGVVNLPLPTAT